MGRRNDHSREQQREMAIAAAELLLIQQGLAGFSMRKVAAAIGYTVGQLYLLFKNQDALFVVINERTAEAIFSALHDEISELEDPVEALRRLARGYIEFALRHPNRWSLLFEHRLPEGQMAPESNVRKVRRMFELVEQQLAVLLPAADAEDLRLEATALWSGVHGVAVLAQSRKLVWSGIEDYGLLTDRLVQGFV